MEASASFPLLSEAYLDLLVNEKALDLFEDDPSLSLMLHKHLLETVATPIVDKFIQILTNENKLKGGINAEEDKNVDTAQLTSSNRISLVKCLPSFLSVKAQAAVEALEGKHVGTFIAAFKDLVEESGLQLKKLDNKLEKSVLESHEKDLTSQISSETDPFRFLPKIVSLLYLQVYSKVLQAPHPAPGNAISTLIARLEDKLPNEAYKALLDYNSATITLLALQSAATEDEEDCTADRILTKKEYLEFKAEELKSLVLKSTISSH